MKTKEQPIFEKYTFKLGSKEEAEAWVVYVKDRVKNLDKKHNPQTPTCLNEEITADGLVTLSIKTEFYRSNYIINMIYPVVTILQITDVENLHIEGKRENLLISIKALNFPYRVKNILLCLDCENLGDALCITEKDFRRCRNAGKKSWTDFCDVIKNFGFSPAQPIEKWVFGKQDNNRKLLDQDI